MTARTLRYYDEIGLLRPACVGANGYRYYEREQLLRLPQILLLRMDLTGALVSYPHADIDMMAIRSRP